MVHSVWDALIKLQRALPSDSSRARVRARWALLDRHKIKKLQSHLSDAEADLNSLLLQLVL